MGRIFKNVQRLILSVNILVVHEAEAADHEPNRRGPEREIAKHTLHDKRRKYLIQHVVSQSHVEIGVLKALQNTGRRGIARLEAACVVGHRLDELVAHDRVAAPAQIAQCLEQQHQKQQTVQGNYVLRGHHAIILVNGRDCGDVLCVGDFVCRLSDRGGQLERQIEISLRVVSIQNKSQHKYKNDQIDFQVVGHEDIVDKLFGRRQG